MMMIIVTMKDDDDDEDDDNDDDEGDENDDEDDENYDDDDDNCHNERRRSTEWKKCLLNVWWQATNHVLPTLYETDANWKSHKKKSVKFRESICEVITLSRK